MAIQRTPQETKETTLKKTQETRVNKLEALDLSRNWKSSWLRPPLTWTASQWRSR